jgi:mono/diheme cytochrome c family protein
MMICRLLLAGSLGMSAGIASEVSYNRDIRPILSDNCFACHGPDEKHRKADLRLDTFDGATADKDGLRALVPGDPAKSELWARLNSPDEDEVMPPPKSHKTVTATQKTALRQWIEQGAKYEKHWSFVPLAPVKVPEVKHADWPRHEVDRFVLSRLEREGLAPSPEATRETLIRRATLDLTGLPPTLAEVDAFLADTSPGAYEKVVARLLKSPHFGERMAVDWLDAARYADSNGYQVDRDRELWPWRDWVIKAFNDNQRFDQFTIEQIAGDLLPNATLEQRIATGFNRNHMLNEEGGIIADEFLAEYTADRVETTAAVWLAQTFNCCRCHDHKFDPFTAKDFYSMKAFFHNTSEKGVGNYSNPIRVNAPPFVKLPAPEIEAKIAGLNGEMKAVNDQLVALAGSSGAGLDDWAQRVAAATVKWETLELIKAEGGDAPPHIASETRTLEAGPQETRANNIKVTARLPAGHFTALRLEFATNVSAAAFQWSEFKVNLPADEGAKVTALALRGIVAGESLAGAETIKLLDNDRKTRTGLSATPASPVQSVFELVTPLVIAAPSEIEIEIGVENANGPSRWRVFATDIEAELLAPSSVVTIAKKESVMRTDAERKQLAEFRLSQQPEHRKLTDQLSALKTKIAAAEGEIPTTLVMDEMKEARPTFVLLRGAYDKTGERVTAATPAVLPALAGGEPRNRLGLAKWLVSPQNPLTARVAVNRLWQQVFGAGLVKTSDDFGAQGAPPSHPELLDWIALEFIRSGWDMKHLMTLMVTSATYRQQSQMTPLLRERDADNRLLARGARFRLMGEFVRDQALATSGLLVEKIGGPSVKPYHPPGLYEQVAAGSGYNVYVPGKGDDLHRRSLYTYWKRSVPNPAMLAFGTPFRESCTLQRPRSNTPLQALNLMNDETYIEASRFLAQRMISDGGSGAEAQLTHGFRLVLSRAPKPEELSVLQRAYARSLADFQKDATAVKSLLSIGGKQTEPGKVTPELAALTTVASTLFCLDETVTKP